MANNLKFGKLDMKLSEELNKIGLRCIWQGPKENSVSRNCKAVK
jgi:hypothetical protein